MTGLLHQASEFDHIGFALLLECGAGFIAVQQIAHGNGASPAGCAEAAAFVLEKLDKVACYVQQ